MTTISSGRRTNRVLLAPPIFRLISLLSSPLLSLSLFLFVPSRSSPSFLFAISFFHPVPSIGPPVGCNYDVRREREENTLQQADCTHGCTHIALIDRFSRWSDICANVTHFTFDVLSNRKFHLWTSTIYSKLPLDSSKFLYITKLHLCISNTHKSWYVLVLRLCLWNAARVINHVGCNYRFRKPHSERINQKVIGI